ncbi:hypothetical protein [Streptomyces sp. AM8-1-1]|uniref:hypothetical protein n=1 Tax=Streptomyces sp. AM8-1-1 TaxID=3075825 RepID=UPI0028C50764|nr:hypothetical protein [Streptomyces sp. AM8-1-1]WNO76835.1 hypothetical protein RPQ07_36730 [Streptomyces sp. AM8-1-1]
MIQLLGFCEWIAANWIAENGGDDARYAARRVNTLALDCEKWTKPAWITVNNARGQCI